MICIRPTAPLWDTAWGLKADSVAVTVSDPNLIHYYPNAQDPAMPAYYKAKTGFPQTLQQSILQFTQASLQRDGLKADVSVAMAGTTAATITMTSSDPAVVKTLAGYGPMLTGFVGNAGLGWNGATGCQNKAGCWDPASATSASPWAFSFLRSINAIRDATPCIIIAYAAVLPTNPAPTIATFAVA